MVETFQKLSKCLEDVQLSSPDDPAHGQQELFLHVLPQTFVMIGQQPEHFGLHHVQHEYLKWLFLVHVPRHRLSIGHPT